MRDPGPARSGPALLCSTRWLTHSLQITENRAELPAISPSTQSRHLLSLFIPSSCCSSKRGKKITKGKKKNQDTTKTETVLWWPKCSLWRVSVESHPSETGDTRFVDKCSIFFLSFTCFTTSRLSGRCTPVFVFRQDEASAASLSARLFLKDMRSYPVQPFPLPANPNKAGMLRERRETEGALFQSRALNCWKLFFKKKKNQR